MPKNATMLLILGLLILFAQACFTPPSPRQPASRLTKESPVKETANEPGSETVNAPEREAGSPRFASVPGYPSAGSPARLSLPFDHYAGLGQEAWGHRRGTTGTSLIIVVVLVTICLVGLAVALSKIHF